jgi:hypothetical protein
MGSWCMASFILNLDTNWWWVVNFTLRSLYSRGKSRRHVLDKALRAWSDLKLLRSYKNNVRGLQLVVIFYSEYATTESLHVQLCYVL